jgi:hypothetical protein
MAYKRDVTVTPSMAAEWLKKNVNNRKTSSNKIKQYESDMREGRWFASIGDPICFDENGNLGNGQHRLKACEAAGVPFTTTVVYDVPIEAIKYVDIGKPRSISDLLRDEKNVTTLSGLVTLICRYKDETLFRFRSNPSRGEQVAVFDAHPEARQYADMAKILPVQKPALAFIWWLYGQVHPNKTREFFEQFASGENITKKNAAWHLRQKLIVNKPTGGRYTQEQVLGCAIAALNAHMTGDTILRLHPSTEPFFAKSGKKKSAAA